MGMRLTLHCWVDSVGTLYQATSQVQATISGLSSTVTGLVRVEDSLLDIKPLLLVMVSWYVFFLYNCKLHPG